jgi:hypothetical protein
MDLPAGRTTLPVRIGMGEIQVLVPDDTCVTVDADISMGGYEPPDGGEEGGVDLEIEDRFPVAAGRTELHVVADIGLGALRVGDAAAFVGDGFPRWHQGAERFGPAPMREVCA